jgi:uncharacterized protein YbbK (DUF523 family)
MTFFLAGSGTDVLDGRGIIATGEGTVMNDVFIKGAEETLEITRLTGCKLALLKDGSPSCGVHRICRNKERVAGMGVTAALLQRNGMQCISEEDL